LRKSPNPPKPISSKVNDEGGVNGRRIQMIIGRRLQPAKTVRADAAAGRKRRGAADLRRVGTPTNSAVHKYLNDKKVPVTVPRIGAAKWDDLTKNFMDGGMAADLPRQAIAYAKYIKASHPSANIGVLYQNDDLGKDYLKALEEGLGSGDKIVSRRPMKPPSPPSTPRSCR
jgi:hypothetical protein